MDLVLFMAARLADRRPLADFTTIFAAEQMAYAPRKEALKRLMMYFKRVFEAPNMYRIALKV